MKINLIKSASVTALLFFGIANCLSQGFLNLNFERAVIVHVPLAPNTVVYASNAIPGWIATGDIGPSYILYNQPSTGAPSVSILDINGHPPALAGSYSVLLYGGFTATSASISQTAVVPVSAESILFKAQSGTGTLQVSLGGQNIPFFALSTGPNYTLYGGNISSAYAGQSEQLMFSALAGENFWNIDDIQFSSSPVPEPSAFALGALGALLFGFRRWRNFLR